MVCLFSAHLLLINSVPREPSPELNGWRWGIIIVGTEIIIVGTEKPFNVKRMDDNVFKGLKLTGLESDGKKQAGDSIVEVNS